MNRTNPVITLVALVLLSATTLANESPRSADDVSAGFEKAQPGLFEKLETAIGTWTAVSGKTVVDHKHAKTGNQCLQLAGGAKTSVILRVSDSIDTSGRLSFWAERWTARKPFKFRIDKKTAKGWQEIYNGDDQVRVGRSFLNHVQVSLSDTNIKFLRFTCTSPKNTGILIDDIRIVPSRPQKIVDVEVVPFTLPLLVDAPSCPLVKLKITTVGNLDPITLTSVKATLKSKAKQLPIDSVFVFPTARENAVRSMDWESPRTLTVKTSLPLEEGENTVWLNCRLRKDADIDGRIGATISKVTFSNNHSVNVKEVLPAMQRLGIALRKGGDDGVHTFRIPGLATTNAGTLIAVYDIRRRGGGDLPGDIDVGMSRSIDGGRSWQPMKVIMDMGDDPQWQYDGIGDPAILVDQSTGTIWVAATWSHGNRSWRGSGHGMTPDETGQLMLVRSDDDGVTWSKPINITNQVKQPDWSFLLQGPGKGITMRDGTIVFPAQYQDPPSTTDQRAHRLLHSTIIYSKDHGKTWQAGAGAFDDTTESQVVESAAGTLMLNCRYNRKETRVVMTTRDMGKTWEKHSTSERSLIEPRACMASLIDVDREVGEDVGNWLLFSNPDSTSGRDHITIKASPDRGKTWPKEYRVLLDEGRSAGYSCMSMIDEKTVGILYEGSQAHMTFQRIPLGDIVGRASSSPESHSKTSQRGLSLPIVFSSHMVLQADSAIPVWGTSEVDAKVSVKLGDTIQIATADKEGRWSVRLPAQQASAKPLTMTIESAGQKVQFSSVLIGEVWLCAGQSNMEWPLNQSANGNVELINADHPDLRLLNLKGGARGSSGSYSTSVLKRLTPETYCEGEWQVASPESAHQFSAVSWYFGRYLQEELKVPVGLICPAVGGTPTEAWIPGEALENNANVKGLVAGNWLDNDRLGEFCRTRGEHNLLAAIQSGECVPGDELGPNHSFKPGFMWDAGIEPLVPYGIRGAIWYQGESNAETLQRVHEHGLLFPLLICQWRSRWAQGDFPFLYVQLPSLNRPQWPSFRDGQRRMLNQVSNVGMAVTIDTGHPSNVHPTLKKPVGERLAKWALGTTYRKSITYSGPLFRVAKRNGDSLTIQFEHVGEGLKSSDKMPLRHFEVCGKDKVFHAAKAKIIGKDTIKVSSPEISEPIHVRYAWVPWPQPPVNLFNLADLPASPFTSQKPEE